MLGTLDKDFLKKMVYFAAIVVFGLLIWLVFTNVLVPEKVQRNADMASLVAQSVDPMLNTQVLSQMRAGKTYTQAQLSDFTIYLVDTDPSAGAYNTFLLRRMYPLLPLDTGYALAEASHPAQVMANKILKTFEDESEVLAADLNAEAVAAGIYYGSENFYPSDEEVPAIESMENGQIDNE